MAWCLISSKADKFKRMLKSKEITPGKLMEMSSAERRKFFSDIFGKEDGKNINAAFEQKLLLKYQVAGIKRWAEKMIKDQPAKYDKSMLKKIETLDTALTKAKMNEFLEDLVEQKVGFSVTEEEFKKMTELSNDATEKKAEALKHLKDKKWETKEDKKKYGMPFGNAKVAFEIYYNELQDRAEGKTLENIKTTYQELGLWEATKMSAKELADFVASNSRAIVASWDNSFWGRQGRKALTRPATSRLWYRNFIQSFRDAGKVLKGGKNAKNQIVNGVKAEIYSRANYLNGRYTTGKKLDVGIREEEFPTSFPERIPVLGRLFSISEATYEAGAMRLRADIADKFYEMAEQSKKPVNLNDNEVVGSINEIVNVMTGRGSLGSWEAQGRQINKAIFSAKFVASQVQTVSKVFTGKPNAAFARKQAANNLLGLVASSALIMAMFSFLWPDRVEWDETSSKFGKIKIGNQWIDLTGGFASYYILAARIWQGQSKDTNTGIITKLNEGYGTDDGMDKFTDFIQNKTSPMASVVKDLIKKKTFEGDRPTIFNEAKSLLTPIIVSTGKESYEIKRQWADVLTALIADGLGFSVYPYVYNYKWSKESSGKLENFYNKVGEKKFDEANEEYNKKVSDMYLELAGDKAYQKMDNSERKNELTNRKTRIKDKIISKYMYR